MTKTAPAFGIIGEFVARPGYAAALDAAIRKVVALTAQESNCLGISAWRSKRDPSRFFIHSCWGDKAAFDAHAALPHTVEFITAIQPLITTSKVEVARLSRIA